MQMEIDLCFFSHSSFVHAKFVRQCIGFQGIKRISHRTPHVLFTFQVTKRVPSLTLNLE